MPAEEYLENIIEALEQVEVHGSRNMQLLYGAIEGLETLRNDIFRLKESKSKSKE